MKNNKDQLSELYRQQAQDKAPEQLNQSVLNIAAKKSEQFAGKNTQTHFFGQLIPFEKSHWLGVGSACCVMILSLSILVPMTQTPLHQSQSVENSHATVSASERILKQRSELYTQKTETMFDQVMDADQSPAIKATATLSTAPVKVSAQKRIAQSQRSKPTLSTIAPKSRSFSAPSNLPKEEIATEQDMIMSDSVLVNPAMESSSLADQYMPATQSPRTAAQWLKIINERLAAKDFESARLAVEDFSRDYPDYEQPENWKVWLHTD
tara:strand:+ start:3846 stop:4643 length:798 start_codon:yes stop_codon:yes gene_type:complete